jgi:hypothetical protein
MKIPSLFVIASDPGLDPGERGNPVKEFWIASSPVAPRNDVPKIIIDPRNDGLIKSQTPDAPAV